MCRIKYYFIFSAFLFSLTAFSQPDTLTSKEMEILKLFGGVIKNVTGDALKENGFGNIKESLVSGVIKNSLKKTVEKSISQLGVPGGFKSNPKAMILLPEQLKKLENDFQHYGKKQLLENLVISMNETASDALSGIAPVIAGKLVDMAVDRIILNANSTDAVFSDAFTGRFQTDLKMEVLPLIEKGLQMYKTTKTLNKINKVIKRKKLDSLNLDINEYVSNGMIDGLLGFLKDEELKLRKDPSSLLDKLIKKINN